MQVRLNTLSILVVYTLILIGFFVDTKVNARAIRRNTDIKSIQRLHLVLRRKRETEEFDDTVDTGASTTAPILDPTEHDDEESESSDDVASLSDADESNSDIVDNEPTADEQTPDTESSGDEEQEQRFIDIDDDLE